MNSFLRKLVDEELLRRYGDQSEHVRELKAEIERMKLDHLRQIRDLVEQFWITQEAGTDVRETLWAGLNDMRDHVARMEEHSR